MHRPLPVLLALGLALAGCIAAPQPVTPAADPGPVPPAAAHVLAGAVEPEGLEAMAFAVLGAVARAGPAGGFGEPAIWAHLDGTLYAAFPGCDSDRLPGGQARRCVHGPVYRSDDAGAAWTRLNAEEDGHLAEDEDSRANGDNEVTVDAAGAVYASNLGNGIKVMRSDDRGATWTYLGNATPENHWADRQWMAAGQPGHLIVTWMGGDNAADPPQRAVAVNTTFDAGGNWTGTTYLGEDIGWLGQVAMDPRDDGIAYIPFTQGPNTSGMDADPTGLSGIVDLYSPAEFQLLVGRTLDGGATWDVVDTRARVQRPAGTGQWSGVLMAPALDVTGDGTVVYAWAEDVPGPAGAWSMGSMVRFVASKDGGATWSEAVTVSERPTSIMPWVTGGAGDRFALTYYATDTMVDGDYVGLWDVMAAVVDGAGTAEPQVQPSVVAAGVHEGGLCARGGLCYVTGSDRTLLDYFESDLLPDGRLVVAFPADPVDGGKYVELRIALQSGGSPLIEHHEG